MSSGALSGAALSCSVLYDGYPDFRRTARTIAHIFSSNHMVTTAPVARAAPAPGGPRNRPVPKIHQGSQQHSGHPDGLPLGPLVEGGVETGGAVTDIVETGRAGVRAASETPVQCDSAPGSSFERGLILGAVALDQPRDPALGDPILTAHSRLATTLNDNSGDD